MIRALKAYRAELTIYLAARKLQRLIERRQRQLAASGFHKHSAAAKLGWSRRAGRLV